jgi:outer membrane protein assembly factor BamB
VVTSAEQPSWTFRLPDARQVSARPPLIESDKVFAVFSFQSGDFFESLLICFDLANGTELWRVPVDHVLSEPVAGPSGTVLVSSFGGNVLAFDPGGHELWRGPGTDRNLWQPTVVSADRIAVPEIAGGARHTWCLDSRTGQDVWKFDSGGHTREVRAADDRLLQITGYSGPEVRDPHTKLIALTARDGSLAWSAVCARYALSLTRLGDRVVVGARGALLMFDLASGRVLAEMPVSDSVGLTAVEPLGDQAVVVADTANALRRVDVHEKRGLLGTKARLEGGWSCQLSAEMVGRPLVSGSDVAALVRSGRICVLTADRGSQAHDLRMPADRTAVGGGIAIEAGRLAATLGRTLAVFEFQASVQTAV